MTERGTIKKLTNTAEKILNSLKKKKQIQCIKIPRPAGSFFLVNCTYVERAITHR